MTTSSASACPYASPSSGGKVAAFYPHGDSSVTSDDETSTLPGAHPPSSKSEGSSEHVAEALELAKTTCPAFKGGKACPFRDARDAEEMKEAMSNVPSSHVGAGGGAVSSVEGGGTAADRSVEGVEGKFRLALEHVHRVGLSLHSAPKALAASSTSGGAAESTSLPSDDMDKFLLKGGCPFKTFYKGADGSEPKVPFVDVMEKFSLGAILAAAMAEEERKKEEEEDGANQEKAEKEDEAKKEDDQKKKAGTELLAELSFEFGAVSENETSEERLRLTTKYSATAPSETKAAAVTANQSGEEEEEDITTLSAALKHGTAESHSAAESVHFVSNFVKGKISRPLFAKLTVALLRAYTALEEELDKHGPEQFPTLHHPRELARKEALEDDVEFFFGDGWERLEECKVTPATKDYVDRIHIIGQTEPLLLLSHAYTRYLGDLSGGRVLMRVARRALNLGRSDDGLRFYKFDNVSNPKQFKDLYRQDLDRLDLDGEQVERLVAEANVAFVLNMRLFEELDVESGVEGACIRELKDATRYHDEVVKEQNARKSDTGRRTSRRFSHAEGGDASKCPFAGLAAAAGAASTLDATAKKSTPVTSASTGAKSLGSGSFLPQAAAEKGERCPWPFVFFHDPVAGMSDWQTWAIMGLLICWIWTKGKVALLAGAIDSA
mmetsp:Transcript_35038/g.104501  ORF Transcript_35038/g.104501 Transcript_35038/m.104501 type:complete len:666 (-) Transcript_35038:722-2719(-)